MSLQENEGISDHVGHQKGNSLIYRKYRGRIPSEHLEAFIFPAVRKNNIFELFRHKELEVNELKMKREGWAWIKNNLASKNNSEKFAVKRRNDISLFCYIGKIPETTIDER